MPGLFDLAEDQRKALAGRDAKAAIRLVNGYQSTLRDLRKAAETFRTDIVKMRQAGIPVTGARLDQMKSFDRLIKSTESKVGRFAAMAERITSAEQDAAIKITQDHTTRMLALSGQPVMRRAAPKAGVASNGEPLATLFDPMAADAANRLRQTARIGLMNRVDAQLIAAQIDQDLQRPIGRTRTIQRTETMSAQREAARSLLDSNRHLVDGWIWHASLGRTCCAACWAMHGSKHLISESMGTHPNCRCTMVPAILGIEGEPTGSQRFTLLSPADQQTILGLGAYAAFKTNELTLNDMVTLRESKIWGVGRHAASLEDAKRNAASRVAGDASIVPRTFKEFTFKEAEEYAASHLDTPDKAGLTELERGILSDYKGHLYKQINTALRADDHDMGEIDVMDRALKKSVIKDDIVVYRGLSDSAFKVDLSKVNWTDPRQQQTNGLSSLEGQVFNDKGYVSTSIGPQPALAGTSTWARINVPNGTNAQYLDHIDSVGEREVLLPRNRNYLITSVTREERNIDGNAITKIVVHMDLIP